MHILLYHKNEADLRREMMSVVYVVSDLHGCYDKYIKLLERLKMNPNDFCIFSETLWIAAVTE